MCLKHLKINLKFYFFILKAIFLCYFIWLCLRAHRIVVPQPKIEPIPPAVEVCSLNHWTTRVVPKLLILE